MITTEQETAIRDVLATMPHLAVGVGTAEQACSIAAINIALTGTLMDTVPDCMSLVVGRWIIGAQDRMPATIRDSRAWRDLLVLSAGTGREHETQRFALVTDWMWDALALVQPQADARGYGVAWATMLRERTEASARAAAAAARAADASAVAAAHAAAGADAAAAAAAAARAAVAAAAAAAAAAARAAYADAYAAARAADAAADADAAAAAAARAAYADADADAAAWTAIDPVGLLQRLIAVTDERALAVQPC